MDHFSRRIVGTAVWYKEPTAGEVIAMLDATVEAIGRTPKYIISDQGVQSREEYQAWCHEKGVRPRFGAVGRYGSVAVLERFMRTLKGEGLRRLVAVPLRELQMTEEVAVFVDWYPEQICIAAVVEVLAAKDTRLGFPYSSGIEGSKFSHMRELRIQHAGDPYRVFYAFDPRRTAMLLIGGCKAGDDRFYERMVPWADRICEAHLQELENEPTNRRK